MKNGEIIKEDEDNADQFFKAMKDWNASKNDVLLLVHVKLALNEDDRPK